MLSTVWLESAGYLSPTASVGNPIYRWQAMAKDRFCLVIERFRSTLSSLMWFELITFGL